MYPRASGDAPQTDIRRIAHNRDDIYNWRMSYEAWQTFNDLRQKGLFYDVALISDEGDRFQAHRIVLCTCGHYFRSLFSGRWKSSEEQEIRLTGVKAWVLDIIIKFAYTRRISLQSALEARELLIAGGHFGIEEILKASANFLASVMTINNSLDLWFFAKTYYCKELESQVFSFILENFDLIARTREFDGGKAIHHLDGDDLSQILESDELDVKDERLALNVIVNWAEHSSPIQRNQCIFRLISSVRLGLLTSQFLSAFLERHRSVLSLRDDVRSLLEHHICLSRMRRSLGDEKEPFTVSSVKKCDSIQLDWTTPPTCDFNPDMCDILRRSSRPRYPREVLLVIGGWSGNAPTASSEAFDPATRNWTDTKRAFPTLLKKPRAYHGVTFQGGYVFVVGGFDGQTTYNSCDRYNLMSGTWKRMCGMHHRRCYVGVSHLEGLIYAVGGSDGDGQLIRLNSAERFDPSINVWTRLPDMTERRSDAGVCGMERRLYVAGGFTGQRCVFSVEYFDLRTHQWCRINPMRIRRSGVTIIAYKGRLLALGGFDGVSSRLNSVEAFDPDSNRWTTLPSMLTGRSNFGACILRDRLVVIGGFNGSTTCNNVEYFDDEEETSVTLDSADDDVPGSSNSRSSRTDRKEDGLKYEGNGRGDNEDDNIDIFNNQGYSQRRKLKSSNQNISPAVWKQLANMKVSRSALSCCVLKDLPPAFLRSVASPMEFSAHDNDYVDSNGQSNLDKLFAMCISRNMNNGKRSRSDRWNASSSIQALQKFYSKQ